MKSCKIKCCFIRCRYGNLVWLIGRLGTKNIKNDQNTILDVFEQNESVKNTEVHLYTQVSMFFFMFSNTFRMVANSFRTLPNALCPLTNVFEVSPKFFEHSRILTNGHKNFLSIGNKTFE